MRKQWNKTLQDNLDMQIIDWAAYDYNKYADADEDDDENDNTGKKVVDRKYLINIYGITSEGQSMCVHVENFCPYFFVKFPQSWQQKEVDNMMNDLGLLVKFYSKKALLKHEIVMRKELYGFTNNKEFKFLKLVFKNLSGYYEYKKLFESPIKTNNKVYKLKLYESNISPILRFIHERDIVPSAWIRIPKGKYTYENKTRCNIEVTVDWNNIQYLDKSEIGAVVVASFDIECTSKDGSFPVAKRKEDQVIQIGTTFHRYGEKKCFYHHIVTLKKPSEITKEEVDAEELEVEYYDTEYEVIMAWAKFIERFDPDVITGYNIWGFDFKYLHERAKTGNGGELFDYSEKFLEKLSRNKERPAYYEEKKLQSSALGDNDLHLINMEGRVCIDLMKVVQRDHKLESYKLDFVAETFLKSNKIDLPPRKIFENFRNGAPDKIKEIAVYCLKDCVLVNHLIIKLEIIANNMGMSNVCLVPFSYLFLRGQGIKIFSLVANECRKEGFLVRVNEVSTDKSGYEGAIVFTPKPGVYFEPVAVNDYASLYPSSMIAENISHDSIVWRKIFDNGDNLLLLYDGYGNIIKEKKGDKYVKKGELQYTDLEEEYEYNEIKYDNFELYDEKKHKDVEKKYIYKYSAGDKVKTGYTVCCFAVPKDGSKHLLPRILMKLLAARKNTRKRIIYKTVVLKDGKSYSGMLNKDKTEIVCEIEGKVKLNKDDIVSCEDTYNEFMKAVWEGLQLSYKTTANSLYGQCGSGCSAIGYKQLAACTTATGRGMVTMAKNETLKKFPGSRLVYGDSVTGDTPLLLRCPDGSVDIKTIETLADEWKPYEEFKPFDTNRREKQQTKCDYQIWTDKGWADIKRVIRHKTQKRIFRVNTYQGCIDVTEDHSLINIKGEKVKPIDCKIGDELMHSFPDVPYELMHKNIYSKNLTNKVLMHELLKGKRILYVKNKDEALSTYVFMKYICKKSIDVTVEYDKTSDSYCLKYQEHDLLYNNNKNKIKQIFELPPIDENTFVYDLETDTGKFVGGVGQILLKNTDSIFISFLPYITAKHGEQLTDYEKLKYTRMYQEQSAEHVSSLCKKPHDLEAEKIFYPFIIFSKKRYVGNKYEGPNIEKFKQNSMGIVLKRRDNAHIVKTIYGGIIDTILNEKNVESAKTYFKESVAKLLNGDVDINELVITKSIRGNYANPTSIAHKVLAERMGERDPGNKPLSNDRIPYCYIDECNLKCIICGKNKLNTGNCKCIYCMRLYCKDHIDNHKKNCVIVCRFCKKRPPEIDIKQCLTCRAYYCEEDMARHMLRTDKYKEEHHDKCKKALTKKILQGDILETPQYIKEQKLKIDYKYYLDHQIQVPCLQIFALVMKNPYSLIEASIRRYNNMKSGNQEISKWFNIGKKQDDDNLEDEDNSLGVSHFFKGDVEIPSLDETFEPVNEEEDVVPIIEDERDLADDF